MAFRVRAYFANGKSKIIFGRYPAIFKWLDNPANCVKDYDILPRDSDYE